jgi:hypothetical protein
MSGFIGFDGLNNWKEKDLMSLFESHRPNLRNTVDLGAGLVVPRYKNISTGKCFNKYLCSNPNRARRLSYHAACTL